MIIRYHRLVPDDVAAVMDRYESEAGPHLARASFEELSTMICQVSANPMRFHPCNDRLRRANLKRFPFRLLYEVRRDYIYITAVRHHKRHPAYGLRRI